MVADPSSISRCNVRRILYGVQARSPNTAWESCAYGRCIDIGKTLSDVEMQNHVFIPSQEKICGAQHSSKPFENIQEIIAPVFSKII